VKDPANEFDRWYIMLEVRNPDDAESKILVLYIGADKKGSYAKNQAQGSLDQCTKWGEHNEARMSVVIFFIHKIGSFKNPVLTEMLAGYSDQQIDDLKKKGGG
jgi:hypothetical protein